MMTSPVEGDAAVPLLPLSTLREGGRRWRLWSRDTGDEVKRQIVVAIPMVLTNVSYYAILLTSVMFAGHLGDLELAASTLANSWSTVTGFTLTLGLSGALETFCGQNFGAKLYRMLGIHLQSSLIISFVFSIIISILWFFSEQVLVFLHQDPQISKVAAVYLTYLIPGLFAYGFLQCILRFLQTQSIVMPLVICSVLPLILHVGLTYLLVHVFCLGLKGTSLGASVSLWISLLMLVSYINFSKSFQYTWEGFSMESLRHVIPTMRLALPSAVMVCLEFWAFEILVLLAGVMPNSQTGSSLIAMCVSTEAIIYNITFGFSAAASTCVSNELGARNAEKAKNAMAVALMLSIGVITTFILILYVCFDKWAKMFSDSPVIISAFVGMGPFLAPSLLLDSIQGILSGVVRGCGWQHQAVWINLGAFYGIGMPLSILFGFQLSLDYKGLWLGLICGLFCQASILLFVTLRINWSELELYVDDKQSFVVDI